MRVGTRARPTWHDGIIPNGPGAVLDGKAMETDEEKWFFPPLITFEGGERPEHDTDSCSL